MLSDIQDEFLNNYSPSDGRSKVSEYNPYFLGTIITTSGHDGKRSIVDGQQRLTTITIILSYLHRWKLDNPSESVANVEQLIRRTIYGDSEFNLEFDDDRCHLFKLLLDNTELKGPQLDDAVDSIPNISPSTREIYKLYHLVDSFISDDIKSGLVPRFVDYFIDKVYLFEIGVPSEQDGHKVFVTMNDRGLRLSPLDLLKGFFLSNISNHEKNASANFKWADCVRALRTLGRDEDSTFFKTWLRAQYAQSTRGKARGDAPADFEVIGDGYHRWAVDNQSLIGLNDSDDFYDLVERKIPFYVKQYIRIRKSEELYNSDFRHVYYNGSRNMTLQSMLILSALDINDTSAVIDKKINLISYFLDMLAVSRILERKDNAYNNIKDIVFSFTNRVRRKSVAEIVNIFEKPVEEFEKSIQKLNDLHYWSFKRQDLLFILSRFGDYLEESMDLTNKVGFPVYMTRDLGNKTFDIEHVVPSPNGILLGYDATNSAVYTAEDDYVFRNQLGGLILLPRGRNRSLKDMNYPDKRERYATENVLASSLTEEFYQNHPNVTKFIAESLLPLSPEPLFDAEAIFRRGRLYADIADRLWSKRALRIVAGMSEPELGSVDQG